MAEEIVTVTIKMNVTAEADEEIVIDHGTGERSLWNLVEEFVRRFLDEQGYDTDWWDYDVSVGTD